MRVLVCLFFLLLAAGAAQWLNLAPHSATASGITYYVDANGNDANNGSQVIWQGVAGGRATLTT